ncbi:DUF6259 domain-containing protein [Paenibacillus sp. GCM10023252]|uniref:DUF6259 domain-containing protein n=1 Tax=Paenibacillus sp. GCM10023252 TaxID=3252649 RepID=UPI00361A814A
MLQTTEQPVTLSGSTITLDTILSAHQEGRLSWQLTAQLPSQPWMPGASKTISSLDCSGEAEAVTDGYHIRYSQLSESEPFSQVEVELRIVEIDRQSWSLSLAIRNENKEPWSIRVVEGVRLSGIEAVADASVYWPNGLGQRIQGVKGLGLRKLSYPSGTGTMPWFAIARDSGAASRKDDGSSDVRGGLYMGTHDADMGKLDLEAQYVESDESIQVSVKHHPYLGPGQSWNSPPFVLYTFSGHWHEAADKYRSWYDSSASIIEPPAWVRQTSGWLLSVLKQQNGDVMWDYRSGIDQLCTVAEERGLDTLGLFGWAHGGHDRCFPDFVPDQLMGGRPELREALKRARERGIRTILYANGVIMDLMTEFYRYHGNDAALLLENRELQVSTVRKFHSATPVPFAMGCTGSEVWQNRMLELAIQANELGADGILFDQIGVYGPDECHNPNHKHKNPATAYTTERRAVIESIAKHMRGLNPDFAIMTEGIHDSVLSGISYVHGWGCGFRPDSAAKWSGGEEGFPELFRYTFPELPMTQRHPTAMMDRYHANYACLYGLRFELETRYRADVRYLLEERVPVPDDYADVAYYPPDHKLMRSMSPEAAKQYLREVITFCRQHSEFFWEGTFVDTRGFELIYNEADKGGAGGERSDGRYSSEGIVAKAYASADGERLAVCVWNRSAVSQQCSLLAGERRLVSCTEPELGRVDGSSPIPAQSVRLYVFE